MLMRLDFFCKMYKKSYRAKILLQIMSSVYKLCIGARIRNPVVPSSIQRVAGRHIPFPQRGLHSKTRLLKLLSVVLQT